MMDKEKSLSDDSPEFAIYIMKRTLMIRLNISDEKVLDGLDPYKWASHDERYRLWVVKGYIELVEPSDPKMRFNLLMGRPITFSKQAAFTFRFLDDNAVDTFKKNMQNLGFSINQMPPREGPWNERRLVSS